MICGKWRSIVNGQSDLPMGGLAWPLTFDEPEVLADGSFDCADGWGVGESQ